MASKKSRRQPIGRLDFIGRTGAGVPIARITWEDGLKETRVFSSGSEAWLQIGELVEDGVLTDENRFFA